ncbi:hypothetical protein SAMN05421688_0010 [Poseidonocella pacifica]|uniref:Uncharacterized protein n=2 Tax=Poseidonocella pacifica TaxID=871651 RepID=A0A1I0Z3C2_9RHOB|nr:hypothetical protein SAMN05421688_0010 [Poseidonocella pacifica]
MLGVMGFVVALLTGCSEETRPDRFELANVRASNVVPKSSATAFVGAFARHCLKGEPAAIEASLLSAGYVQARGGTGPARSFVVDDKRPLVILSEGGCAVGAAPRTGQTPRVQSFVTQTFPGARAVDPQALSAERAWQLADGTLILTTRSGTPGLSTATYLLGLTYPAARDT